MKQLLGRDQSQAMAGERADHARAPPGVIYLDSMGSSGLGWRTAIANVLLQYHAESNPSQSFGRAPRLLDTGVAELGPQISAPHQENMWSCALYLLKNMQEVVRHIVKPSLGSAASSAHRDCDMLPTLDTIINKDWYSSKEAEAMLHWLKESAIRFVPQTNDNSEIQESSCDGDVFLDEIATMRENMDRENRLTAEVMGLLDSLQIQELDNCSEGIERFELVIFNF
jgi:hypothetical protein